MTAAEEPGRPPTVKRDRVRRHLLKVIENAGPGLAPADLETGNFYRLLRERFGITVRDAAQTIEPAVTNPGQAELLEIAVYAPVLHIERLTRDTTGRIVELTRSVYCGDRYRITSKLRFDAESG